MTRTAWLATAVVIVLAVSATPAGAQQKHALLFIGEMTLPAGDEQIAQRILESQQYTVHKLRSAKKADLDRTIGELAALSRDPKQGGWSRFAFYYIGHGGAGLMALSDERDKETDPVFTEDVALRLFNEIATDAFTFVFDMCDSGLAVAKVRDAEAKANSRVVGWMLLAAGTPNLGDGGSTYDARFTKAIESCVSMMSGPADRDGLHQCLRRLRFNGPWYFKSLTGVEKVNVAQPADVPVF